MSMQLNGGVIYFYPASYQSTFPSYQLQRFIILFNEANFPFIVDFWIDNDYHYRYIQLIID